MQIRILLYWRNWKSFLSSVYTIKEAMCDERALTKQRVDGHLKRRMCVVLWPFKIPRQECRRTFYSVVYYQQAMTFFSSFELNNNKRQGICLQFTRYFIFKLSWCSWVPMCRSNGFLAKRLTLFSQHEAPSGAMPDIMVWYYAKNQLTY